MYDELAAAQTDDLSADQLDALADAAFWTGRPRECIAARQQAYRRYRDLGDRRRATRAAWMLFYSHLDLDEIAAASGWLQHAHRHVLDLPEDVESRYVALADADWALLNGRLEDAAAQARGAAEGGRLFGDRDLDALATATLGRILISQGDAPDGVERLDEAMVAAVNGDLSPFVNGWVFCLALTTCYDLGDVRRAAEWSDQALLWSQEHGERSGYRGVCRLHRCEVQSLRGDWTAAERELRRAMAELAPFGAYLVADGQYLAGEIRRRRGDYGAAEAAFRRAHQLGRDPQPGLALLRLAQGDADGAAAALRLALAVGRSGGPLRRGRLLAARVDVELRRGDVEAAAAASTELNDLAAASRVPYLEATAAAARGAILLARDDAAALRELRDARDTFLELSCLYEAAEARVQLATAMRTAGDEDTARMELEAAGTLFDRLSAVPGAELVRSLLSRGSPGRYGLTSREVEVLRLVARGNTNRAIASTLSISEHTVARHISNIFHKIDVSSRSAATAFAYEHDLA